MSDYTPTMEVVRDALTFPRERLGEPRPISSEAFDRFIAKVKADALREWADAQDALIEKFPDRSNEAGRAVSHLWTKAVRTRADRLEGATNE